jgi:hypothetical protein
MVMVLHAERFTLVAKLLEHLFARMPDQLGEAWIVCIIQCAELAAAGVARELPGNAVRSAIAGNLFEHLVMLTLVDDQEVVLAITSIAVKLHVHLDMFGVAVLHKELPYFVDMGSVPGHASLPSAEPLSLKTL